MTDGGTDNQPPKEEKKWSYVKPTSFGDLVNGLTFAVLFITMIGVFWYACEAKKQTAQLILDGRPILIANYSEAFTNGDGFPQWVNPRLLNFGKTVAKDVAPIGHMVFGQAGIPTPRHPDCDKSEAPKDAWTTDLGAGQPVNRAWGWEQGPTANTGSGPVVYIVGCVYYKDLGDSPFYSDVCMTWSKSDGIRACNDRSRNFVR